MRRKKEKSTPQKTVQEIDRLVQQEKESNSGSLDFSPESSDVIELKKRESVNSIIKRIKTFAKYWVILPNWFISWPELAVDWFKQSNSPADTIYMTFRNGVVKQVPKAFAKKILKFGFAKALIQVVVITIIALMAIRGCDHCPQDARLTDNNPRQSSLEPVSGTVSDEPKTISIDNQSVSTSEAKSFANDKNDFNLLDSHAPELLIDGYVYFIAKAGANILATTDNAIMVSTDGKIFRSVRSADIETNSKYPNLMFSSEGNELYAFQFNSHPVLYLSENYGITWKLAYLSNDQQAQFTFFLPIKTEKYDGILFWGYGAPNQRVAKWINFYNGKSEIYSPSLTPEFSKIHSIDNRLYFVNNMPLAIGYCLPHPGGQCFLEENPTQIGFKDIIKFRDSFITYDGRGIYIKRNGEAFFRTWKKWNEVKGPAVGPPYGTYYKTVSDPNHNWQPLDIANAKAISSFENNFAILLDTNDSVSWVYMFDSLSSQWRISLPVRGVGNNLLFHNGYIYVATSAGLYRFQYKQKGTDY